MWIFCCSSTICGTVLALLKLRWSYLCEFISEISILLYWSISLSRALCPYHTVWLLWLCGKFWNWKLCLPKFVLFFRIALDILSPLHFHMNFRINLSISVKEDSWNFGRIVLNSVAQFEDIDLPVYECQISLYLPSSNFSAMFCNSQCTILTFLLN